MASVCVWIKYVHVSSFIFLRFIFSVWSVLSFLLSLLYCVEQKKSRVFNTERDSDTIPITFKWLVIVSGLTFLSSSFSVLRLFFLCALALFKTPFNFGQWQSSFRDVYHDDGFHYICSKKHSLLFFSLQIIHFYWLLSIK